MRAGRPVARAGQAAAAALGRTQLAPSDRRSVACAGGAERQRWPGRDACSSGVVMVLGRAATGRQQGSERGARVLCRARREEERGGESKGGKVNYLTRFKFKIIN